MCLHLGSLKCLKIKIKTAFTTFFLNFCYFKEALIGKVALTTFHIGFS